MPSASEFSPTPASNTTIGGVNMGEGCSPAGLNDAIRYVAATVRVLFDATPSVDTLMPKAGGSFTGEITRQGKGAYLHHVNAAQAAGQVHIVPEGTARPAAAEGVVVLYYT